MNIIEQLRSLNDETINEALEKGWSPSVEGLYDNFIDYASGPLSGGSVDEAIALAEIANDEDEDSQWERMLETGFLFRAAEHWLERQ